MSSTNNTKASLPTDPKIIGPGTWYAIHTMAMSCEDIDSCLFFIQFLKAIIESFPCEKCRIHAMKFIEENPPEKYLHITNDIDEHIGMFKLSWEFHNSANRGLNKPIISFAEAWKLYSEPSICTEDCGKDEDDIPPPSTRNASESHNRSSYLVMKGSLSQQQSLSQHQQQSSLSQHQQQSTRDKNITVTRFGTRH